MSATLQKLIVRVVEKRNGIKLNDLFKYLESKSAELKIEVTSNGCKEAAAALFAEKKIDLIEYKLPGEGEKNRMFLLPIGCTVVHSEDASEDEVFSQLAQETSPTILLSPDMFQTYHVVGEESFVATDVPEHAKALYLKALANNEMPRLYGAVPISIECEISYTPPTSPLVSTEELAGEASQSGEGTPVGTGSDALNA